MVPTANDDWRSLYPFQSHFLGSADGPRQHYLDEGSGRPLLMVHGNPTWSFYWRQLVMAWRSEFRVVVPDHLGCGLSDKPQHYAYTFSTHVANLAALVERLDLRQMTLLAHDWGGAIGLAVAERMPERFSQIVLFNTGAFPPPFIPWRIAACRIPLVGTFAVRGLNLFARAALHMATERPERFTPAVRAGYLAPYDTWSHRIAIQRFVADIPRSPRHPTWKYLQELESRLSCLAHIPLQFVWGMRDWCFTPACLERLRQHFPRAEVICYQDAGHYIVEDAVEQIIPAVGEFLRRCPAKNVPQPAQR